MNKLLSRREFLKLGSLAAGGFVFGRRRQEDEQPSSPIGRVSTDSISVFDSPVFDANTVGFRFRDELLNLYYEITPRDGPAYNPLWYRVWGGYVHSAFIQPVDIRFNQMLSEVRAGGQLTEVTIPFSKPYTYSSLYGWRKLESFSLYYGSTHWVTDIVQGEDKLAWYQITDELYDGFEYYVPVEHLRPILDEELTPISPDIPPSQKRIEVSRKWQTLTAFEDNAVVMHTNISTGVRSSFTTNGYSTTTPQGRHNVMSKMPSKHMGPGGLAGVSTDSTPLPGVPWTCFFAEGGYALHGTYWHNNFGVQMSRGCVNMRNEDAKWLFRWLLPKSNPPEVEVRGNGTKIEVL